MPKITRCDHPCEEYFEYGDCPCTGLTISPERAEYLQPLCSGCNRPFLYCPCKALDHPTIYPGEPGYDSAWALWQEECRLAGGAAYIDFQHPPYNTWGRS